MDKWDEMVSRVKNGILAEEPEAALSGALEMFAEFARTVEQMGADIARVADAMEPQNIQTPEDPPAQVHDL